MEAHVAEGQNFVEPEAGNDETTADRQWMSQWSLEEELFADYTHMAAPWERSRNRMLWFVSAAALMALVGLGVMSPGRAKAATGGSQFFSEKQHLV